MSMLIPKQWEHKMAFMLEATKAFATTTSVFRSFDCEPRRVDVLDYSGFVDAMVALCRKHRRDRSGIEDMQTAIAVFDSYPESVRLHRALEDDEFRRGLASAQRYRWWLHQTFPDARLPLERN
jgi:hypothetical protein